MGLIGIALALGLLIWLAYKGWIVTKFIANASAAPIMLSIALAAAGTREQGRRHVGAEHLGAGKYQLSM